jgi:hypothetical protein
MAAATPSHRTPRGLRRALVGMTAAVAVLLVGYGALLLLDLFAHAEERSTRVLPAVDAAVLDTDGDVRVVAGDGRRTVLETIERTGLFGGPDVSVSTSGGMLRVRSRCPLGPSVGCEARHVLHVPPGTRIRLDAHAGDVTVEGVTGTLDLATGSGEIRIVDAGRGEVRARTGSGDVALAGVRADRLDVRTGSGEIAGADVAARTAEVQTGSGDVRLGLAIPPLVLRGRTGSGEIWLEVPDAVYQVRTETGSGDEDVQVAQDPDARNRLDLETGSGDIRVRRR